MTVHALTPASTLLCDLAASLVCFVGGEAFCVRSSLALGGDFCSRAIAPYAERRRPTVVPLHESEEGIEFSVPYAQLLGTACR